MSSRKHLSSSLVQYYGGDAGDLGNVKRLTQCDFPSLVKELFGHPIVLNLTRDQFHKLDKKRRDEVKKVPYVTPCTFHSERSQRLYEKAATVSLICLDIDDSRHAAPFANRPQLVADALEPWACAVHTTISSTPEMPRLRIFVSAANLPKDHYARAVAFVARRLGLPEVTRESKVVVQPMYLPCLFRDDDPLSHHPLLLARIEGPALTLEEVNHEVDEDGGVPSAPRARPTVDDGTASVADLDFLRPTSDDVTMEDVVDALDALDPDCTYPEWLEVAAALRHQFPHDPEAAAAYEAFDNWSGKGAKYAGEEETRAKWNSLRATPKGRAPVTIRTLLHRASEAGWNRASAVAARCYNNTMAWLSDPDRTASELLSQAAKRIAGTPLISHLERGTLLSRLQDVLKQRKLKVSRADLKKEMAATERELKGKDAADVANLKATPDNQLPPWARGLCYVAGANEFYQRAANRSLNPEVLDNVFGVYLMNGDSDGGKPSVRPRDYLLNLARIPRVDNYRYDPQHPEQVFVQEGKMKFVNIYIPCHPEADQRQKDAAGDALLQHAENLLSDPREQCLLLDYFAYQVQNPGVKIRWATLLQGAEGCGKTLWSDVMRAALGPRHVTSVDANALLTGGYNEWATGAQLVVMEEVRVAGHNRYEVMNKLKPCISNDFITITQRYRDTRQVPNNTNYLLLTNHHDSLALQDGDRRYFVLHSRVQSREQVLELRRNDYFAKLYDVINTKSAGIRAFLEDWELSREFNPNGHAPSTVHRLSLIDSGASPLTAAVRNALKDADSTLVRPDLVSLKHLRAEVEKDRVGQFSDQALAAVLRELGYRAAGRARVGEERASLWVKYANTDSDEQVAANARKRWGEQGQKEFAPL